MRCQLAEQEHELGTRVYPNSDDGSVRGMATPPVLLSE